ncbi:hypothetical protein CEE36_06295 [candidate division TA06 bacterium B3_TA06]|uniref:Secretion system C-terminal sorting domain-containing protein n=1 Tax=candidate division TA06 bacterium B3_TA06 TaxID=2012487 RepID=A0A532V6U8_UNCT6|nr:MAG: hypothetical protein CEE36_06295 [candidate division TA06 bacterium B3_TA06]
MRRYGLIVVGMLFALNKIPASKIVTQNDWHGGPGITEPADNWGIGFYESANINYLYQWGRLSLSIVINSSLSPEQHHIGDMRSGLDKKLGVGNMDEGPGSIVDLDVIVAGSNGIRWYENDGTGNFSTYHYIPYSYGNYLGYDIADFNFDGADDIVIGNYLTGKVWLYLNDGGGNFPHYTSVGNHPEVHQVAAKDFDNDGDIDVVSTRHHKSFGGSYWFKNDGTNQNFTRYTIESIGPGAARRINAGDLDADGDIDFVVGSFSTYWYENRIEEDDDPEHGFVRHSLDYHKNLYDWIGDVDKDGYLDIITANIAEDESRVSPTWWENDGTGKFYEHPLSPASYNAEAVVSIDIDYDGDIDIIQSFWNGGIGELGWYENDGNQNFTYYKYVDRYHYSCDLQIGDISGNGLLDLITSTHSPGTSIDWWELFDSFAEQGELTSCIFDAGAAVKWEAIEWDEETPEGTNIAFKVRTSNSIDEWPDWSTCQLLDDTTIFSLDSVVDQDTRYLQYKTILSTSDPDYSSFLYEVRVTYDDAPAVAELPESSCELRVEGNTVYYTVALGETGRLSVFDVVGRRIVTEEVSKAGCLELKELPAGLYFVRLEYSTGTVSRKVVLIR